MEGAGQDRGGGSEDLSRDALGLGTGTVEGAGQGTAQGEGPRTCRGGRLRIGDGDRGGGRAGHGRGGGSEDLSRGTP